MGWLLVTDPDVGFDDITVLALAGRASASSPSRRAQRSTGSWISWWSGWSTWSWWSGWWGHGRRRWVRRCGCGGFCGCGGCGVAEGGLCCNRNEHRFGSPRIGRRCRRCRRDRLEPRCRCTRIGEFDRQRSVRRGRRDITSSGSCGAGDRWLIEAGRRRRVGSADACHRRVRSQTEHPREHPQQQPTDGDCDQQASTHQLRPTVCQPERSSVTRPSTCERSSSSMAPITPTPRCVLHMELIRPDRTEPSLQGVCPPVSVTRRVGEQSVLIVRKHAPTASTLDSV